VGDGDEDTHLIAILASDPGDWVDVNSTCMAKMEEARMKLGDTGETSQRRGAFATVGTGFSYGGGQTQPMNFSNKGVRAEVVELLNKEPCFRRIAGFQSCE